MKFSFALLFSLFTIFSYGQYDVHVYYEYTPKGYALYADNKESFPLIIEFEFKLLNLKVVREGPSAIVIPAKSKKIKLVDLVAIKVFNGYSFTYTYTTREDTRPVVTIDPLSNPDIGQKTEGVDETDQSVVPDLEVPAAKTKKKIRNNREPENQVSTKPENIPMSKSDTETNETVVIAGLNPQVESVASALPDVSQTPVIGSDTETKSTKEDVSKPEAVPTSELRDELLISVTSEEKTLPDSEQQLATSGISMAETISEEEEKPATLAIPEVETLPQEEAQPLITEIPEDEIIPKEESQPVTSEIPVVKTVPREMEKPVTVAETTEPPVITIPTKPIVKYPPSGKHDAAFKYFLPFKKGGNYLVSQGYQGTFSHKNKFALDFAMPVGTEIYAARDGIVSEIVQNNSQGCTTRDCAKYENYILINHSDGSFARYAHIRKNGAVVQPGESIDIGQHIGYSGDVGWTSEPSLHFEVFVLKASEEKSLKTNFLLGDGSDYGTLFAQQSYIRKY